MLSSSEPDDQSANRWTDGSVSHVFDLISSGHFVDTSGSFHLWFQSLLKRQGEMENGTVWSNSSESSDDSSSPALAHHAQRLTTPTMLQSTLSSPLSFTPHKSSASTPSLSSNQEEDETEAGEVFPQAEPVPNGHLQTACSRGGDAAAAEGVPVHPADLSHTSTDLSCSCPDVSCTPPGSLMAVQEDAAEDLAQESAQTEAEDSTAAAREGHQGQASIARQSVRVEEAATVSCCTVLQESGIRSRDLTLRLLPL